MWRFLHRASFALSTVLALMVPQAAEAQSEGVTFSVANNQTVSTPWFEFSVTTCTPWAPTEESAFHSTTTGGVNLDMFGGPGACDNGLYSKEFFFGVTLAPGSNNISVTTSDSWWFYYEGNLTVTYDANDQPKLDVTSSGSAAQATPGALQTREFRIANPRTAQGYYTLQVSCTGVVTCTGYSQPTEIMVQPGAWPRVEVQYSATGAVGAQGSITLKAFEAGNTSNRDSTTVPVQVLPTGHVADRSQCLIASLGPSAAFECGTLRLDHALPTVRTINTPRTPVLTYNSDHAHPYPIVAMNATLPSGSPTPDNVEIKVWLNGVPHSRQVSGSQFPAGQSRRASVPIDAIGLATGLYPYTIEVRALTGANSVVIGSQSGEVAIVNRSASPFGAGWWLAGYEELISLDSSRVLWIGGDGSTKVYQSMSTTGTHKVYMATRRSQSDSLLKRLNDNTWSRRLTNGGAVNYSALFRHTSTVNRLGHTTTFSQDTSGRLVSIQVPPNAANLSYVFAYTPAGKLDSVIAPEAIGPKRVVQVSMDGAGRITQLADPGLPAVAFAYANPFAEQVISRTDRRGTRTTYTYDSARRIASSWVPVSALDTSRLTLCAGESAGLTTCQSTLVSPVDLRTSIDGPRIDVNDATQYWITAEGVPYRIRDAVGGETHIARGDARFPALVTRMRTPDGRIMSAEYNERALLAATTDSSMFVGGAYNRTRYWWHDRWNEVTNVLSSVNVSTFYAYDSTTGNLSWEEDGRTTPSKISYGYDSNGLLRYTQRPGGTRDSVYYDSVRWNVARISSAMGRGSSYVTDNAGRVIVTTTTPESSVTVRDLTYYSAAGLVLGKETFAEHATNLSLDQFVGIYHTYDEEGNKLSSTRTMSPNPENISSLVTSWLYDPIGRRIREVAPGNVRDSLVYNLAGNVIQRVTARGHNIRMTYDAMGREIQRVADAPISSTFRVGVASSDTTKALNTPYGGYSYSAFSFDTTTFAYDTAGRILSASNRDSRVTRSYTGFGAIKSESLYIRTWNRASEHEYGIAYGYDRVGRLTTLVYPSQLVEGPDTSYYAYDATTGALSAVTGLKGEVFGFGFNYRNELTQLSMPGSITLQSTFDNDGTEVLHRRLNQTPMNVPNRFSGNWFDSTVVTYDAGARMRTRKNSTNGLPRYFNYSTLGQVAYSTTDRYSMVYPAGVVQHDNIREYFKFDPMGNLHVQADTVISWQYIQDNGFWIWEPVNIGVTTTTTTHDAASGRLTGQSVLQQLGITVPVADIVTSTSELYDAAGNVTVSSMLRSQSGTLELSDRVSYYDAEGRVVAAERRRHYVKQPGANWANKATLERHIEQYRYDALGRRILVHSTVQCTKALQDTLPRVCGLGRLRRIVWAGERELLEIQRPVAGFDNATVAQMESDVSTLNFPFRSGLAGGAFDINTLYGRVAYTYGPALDRPLSIARFGYGSRKNAADQTAAYQWPTFTLVPHWNIRGEATQGTFSDGALQRSTVVSGATRWVDIRWAEDGQAFTAPKKAPDGLQGWHGSLIDQKIDQVGTMYRRNRQYDPQTGRFTQPDPIGLQGGLNLYGYANADPINFWDPFGLCPYILTGKQCGTLIGSAFAPAPSTTASGIGGSECGMTRFNADGSAKAHSGFDWLAPIGTAVYAPADATVTARANPVGGLGVFMDLGNGASVQVQHLASYVGFNEGETRRVVQGTLVGYTGVSGNSLGSGRDPHGHVVTKINGAYANPRMFFGNQTGGAVCTVW